MTIYDDILNYIKTHREVSIPMLQMAYSEGYLSVSEAVRKLVSEGKLEQGEGVFYTVVQTEPEKNVSDVIEERRAYLEARRQEILKRMQKELEEKKKADDEENKDNDDDDNDGEDEPFAMIQDDAFDDADDDDDDVFDDDEDEEDDAFDDDEDEEGDEEEPRPELPVAALHLLKNIFKKGLSVSQNGKRAYVVSKGLRVDGAPFRFRLIISAPPDGIRKLWLSDDCFALRRLGTRLSVSDAWVAEQIQTIADRYGVEVVGNALRLRIVSQTDATACLFKFFAAVECVAAIGLEVPAKENGEAREGVPAEENGETPSAQSEAYPEDPTCIEALAFAVRAGSVSVSFVQRKCCVGYYHAVKIVDWMERMGYISPFGLRGKSRSVFLSEKQFQEKYGDIE